MLGLFSRRREVLDEVSVEWQFDLYAWAMRQFGGELLMRHTQLVTPTNQYFPGRVDSVPAMARLVFEQVREYALMRHWPCRLLPQSEYDPVPQPWVAITGAPRIPQAARPPLDAEPLLVTYDPSQVGNPQALIASFAHTLAHYLASMATEPPPGGEENWPHACEILAGFLGFGLMLANSASTFRRAGCGGCAGQAAGRDSYLSQFDLTYALALFATLKTLPGKRVLPHLKRPLRPYYRAAVRDIAGRSGRLAALQRLSAA